MDRRTLVQARAALCVALATAFLADNVVPVNAETVRATVTKTPASYRNPAPPNHLERLPRLAAGDRVRVDLVLLDRTIEIAPGQRYRGWTFNGAVPGPVIHARVGDTIDVTLTNRAAMGHSIDFHAALAPPDVAYQTIEPGRTLHFSWVAHDPGAFLYHCGTPPVLAHISNGMYGAIIIDPRDRPAPAQSFVLVQSEFYPAAVAGTNDYTGDFKKMESGLADVVTFNGRAFQYVQHPLAIRVGQPVRVYVVDAGPSHFSAFHIVGTLLRNVYADGNPANVQHGMQTASIPPGGGAIVEFTVHQAGRYPFVTHQFGDADHGAMGIFDAR